MFALDGEHIVLCMEWLKDMGDMKTNLRDLTQLKWMELGKHSKGIQPCARWSDLLSRSDKRGKKSIQWSV